MNAAAHSAACGIQLALRYHHTMPNNTRVDEVAVWQPLVAAMLCLGMTAPVFVAQRRAPGAPAGSEVPITIALKVGGEAFQLTGQGRCRHAPRASIYDVPAEQWSVQHRDAERGLSLTMWRPTKGTGDMMTLAVNAGGGSHSITTVKAGQSGPTRGSGTISLAPSGKGGTFTIDAAAPDGTRITGTIQCAAFTAAIAEGGD
jgi:hypothetical protein